MTKTLLHIRHVTFMDCPACGKIARSERIDVAPIIATYLAGAECEEALMRYLSGDDAGGDSAGFRKGLVVGSRPFAKSILQALRDSL